MNVATKMVPEEAGTDQESVLPQYLECLGLVERLHRRLLDVIKDDFERIGWQEINAVQALLLFNIGDSELTAGELRSRGHYLGSNVSYNLKKLVDSGYIHHERSEMDRRSVRVRLTIKGQEVRDRVEQLFNHHAGSIGDVGDISEDDFAQMNIVLARLERFWTDQNRYRL